MIRGHGEREPTRITRGVWGAGAPQEGIWWVGALKHGDVQST